MTKVLPKTDGVECRACGAAFARPSHKSVNRWREGPQREPLRRDICDHCDRGYERFLKGFEATEDLFNGFLAKKLLDSAQRLRKNGVCGRCEALVRVDFLGNWKNFGSQCSRPATEILDGRKVCFSHWDRDQNTYVEIKNADPNAYFVNLLKEVCEFDPEIKKAVMEAIT